MEGDHISGMQAAMGMVRTYTGGGSPDLASEIVSAVRDIDDESRAVLMSEGDVVLCISDAGQEESDAVRAFLEGHGLSAVGRPRCMSFVIDGEGFGFLTCDTEGDSSDIHGIVIHHDGGDEVFGDPRTVMCEAALFAAMRMIISDAESDDLRRNIDLRGFLSVLGVGSRAVSRDEVFAPWGLRKHRLDRPRDALRALGAVMGLYKGFDRVPGMNIDLGGKSRRIRALEETTPLRACFDRVEFNNRMSSEDAEDIGRCFSELLESGLLPRVPEGFHAAVRFRRYRNVKIGDIESRAWYTSGFRTIVVNSDDPGAFVHEYAHLMDHACGNLSAGSGFDTTYGFYCDEVRRAFGDRPFDRRYYFRRCEAFARCFEIYVRRHHPECILIDTAIGDPVHPDSETLGDLVDLYFTETWWDAPGNRLRVERVLGIGRPRRSEG